MLSSHVYIHVSKKWTFRIIYRLKAKTFWRISCPSNRRSCGNKRWAADGLLLFFSYFHPVCDLCALTLKQQAALMLSGLHYRLHLTLQSIRTLHTWPGLTSVFMLREYCLNTECFCPDICNKTNTNQIIMSSMSDQFNYTLHVENFSSMFFLYK